MTTPPTTTGPVPPAGAPGDRRAAADELAARVAAAVLAFPGVAGPHSGLFNEIATWLASGRLVGVRIGAATEPVEVGVVLRLDRPIPEVVAGIRRMVSSLCGGARVDITVGDITVEDSVTLQNSGTLQDSTAEDITVEDGVVFITIDDDTIDDDTVEGTTAGSGVATPPTAADPGRMVR